MRAAAPAGSALSGAVTGSSRLRLGIDTGGTYTDAVLVGPDDAIIASAKALTTRDDLAKGVGEAIEKVLREGTADARCVECVSLSTTLATNALVERKGDRIALAVAGFSPRDLAREGLEEALAGDPLIRLPGGHNHDGTEAEELETGKLREWLRSLGDGVSAFAVAGRFATRNPSHEIRVRDMIRAETGKPVSCSHELSARLNGPRRASTAILNARLIGMIDHLVGATEALLTALGIEAPFMIVRGDGSLVSAAQAREKPIETILSGPAASVVSACRLSGATDAIVADIGGTTTDVAVLRAGLPETDPDGARVGGYRTMVQAVAMRTVGLGGDSEVAVAQRGRGWCLTLGPQRVVPVSLCARKWPEHVLPVLDRQLGRGKPQEFDGRFVMAIRKQSTARTDSRESVLLSRLDAEPRALGDVVGNRVELGVLERLVSRGLVAMAGITPSDAAHARGLMNAWDGRAAQMALENFARRPAAAGAPLAGSGREVAGLIVSELVRRSADNLLECAFEWDARDFGEPPEDLARHAVTQAGLNGYRGILKLDAGLNLPLVALGAPAPAYFRDVGKRLSTRVVLPEFAHVANAFGAVVGQVAMEARGHVTSPGEGVYRVHWSRGMTEVGSRERALDMLRELLSEEARAAAAGAGVKDAFLSVRSDVRHVPVDGTEVFLQADLSVSATGRPGIVTGESRAPGRVPPA